MLTFTKCLKAYGAPIGRAAHCFLNVHKFAPALAVQGDMAGNTWINKTKMKLVTLWNCLLNMSEYSVNKKVCLWSKLHNIGKQSSLEKQLLRKNVISKNNVWRFLGCKLELLLISL